MPTRADVALTRVRALCLSFPDTSERTSQGSPSFFVKEKKAFVYFVDNHHGDGRLAVWCAAPPDAQVMLIEADPEVFFVPPYVGHLGWIGARLDRGAPWDVIANAIQDAYKTRATPPVRRARKR